MVKVAVSGACGKMGTSILNTLFKDKNIDIVGALEIDGHPMLGSDLGSVLNSKKTDILVTDDPKTAFRNADVVVDFTSPSSTLLTAGYCSRNKKALVIGTTGFTSAQKKKLEKLIKKIPTVISPNMSVGINLLFELSKILADRLGKEFDVEIFESHHRNKVDAPSGTAIRLAESVAEGLGVNPARKVRYERHGEIGKRKEGEIGIQTIRGGDVVGDHTVMFLGEGERIELTHRAQSRENFSSGVLRAVKWLEGKPPGIYTMKDVLGL